MYICKTCDYSTDVKCNFRKLSSYKNISKYLEKLINVPKVAETIYNNHIVDHYYLSHQKINPFGIIPIGVQKLLSYKTE